MNYSPARFFLMLMLALLCLLPLSPAQAEEEAPTFTALTGEARNQAIADIERYVSGIRSVVANFTQHSADGSTGSGKFFMKRPGKMRWEYHPPTPILLVSDGRTLTYYDPGLDQISYISAKDTLAAFLVQKEIHLDSAGTRLTALEGAEGLLRATLVQTAKPNEGRLTIEFSTNPLGLSKLITTDATGNTTMVELSDVTFGPVLDDALFTFVDPRGVHHRRKGVR